MRRYDVQVTEDPLAFRFDGGATWLNLLATRGRSHGAHPVERLTDPDRLADWLARSELTPSRAPDHTDLVRARDLRETLRGIAEAAVEHRPPPAAALTALTQFLAEHPDPVRLRATPHLHREPPADTTAALARIARQAADHLTGADRHTLRICAEQDCRWVFADPTGRRHWCPAPACASRGRVRALRARRREQADPPADEVSAPRAAGGARPPGTR